MAAIVSACGAGKALTSKKAEAETYYQAGDYKNALIAYQKVIGIFEENNNTSDCPVYTKAGECAYNSGDVKLAIAYLKNDESSSFTTEATYYFLAKSYNEIDNLSLELLALRDYISKFSDGVHIDEVRKQLFLTYVESENYDSAKEIWPEVSSLYPANIELLEAYFSVNKGLSNTDSCMAIAGKILEVYPANTVALEWFGKYYYRSAEDRYQKEMKAYDINKTTKQYRILLSALDVVTVDFKKSLKYFKKLYGVDPKAEYADYLSHIYNRLSDKKKAEYYRKLSN